MAALGVYAHDFVYELGERKADVRETATAGRLHSLPEDLESAGFRAHYRCDPNTGAYDLARAVTTRLADTGRLGSVDAIVYATCLPQNGNAGDPAEFQRTRDVKHLMDFPVSRLQADFGLERAVAIGLNQQACTAMLGSIRLAGAMLRDEESWERVLCVTADRFPEGALYEQAYNLISDGAAACVVSRQPAGFRLVAAHQMTNGGLGQASDDETVGTYFSYTLRLVRTTLDKAGLAPSDLDWVVTQNTNDKAWRILARLLRIDFGKVYYASMPEVGHIISADNVVNLSQLIAEGKVAPGQYVALVMAGFGLNWQCLILQATEDPTA